MASPVTVPVPQAPSVEILMQYVSFLRKEILQAQKLRFQVVSFKIGLLGAAFSYFLQRSPQTPLSTAILVCPFVALLFDCMIHALGRSIQGWGQYMREFVEPYLQQKLSIEFDLPENWKLRSEHARMGRRFAGLSNVGTTAIAGFTAFVIVPKNLIRPGILVTLAVGFFAAWVALIWFDRLLWPNERSTKGPV